MIFLKPLYGEELECNGGSLFEENRSFEFSKDVNTNDEIYFFENIKDKKGDGDDFIVTLIIKDFLITYISMRDKKLDLFTDIFTTGFKAGSISGSKKKDHIFITCNFLD